MSRRCTIPGRSGRQFAELCVGKQRIDKRAPSVPQGWMDNLPPGFVQNQQMFVFVDNIQGQLLPCHLLWLRRRDGDGDLRTLRHFLPCFFGNLPIYLNQTLLDQLLNSRAGRRHLFFNQSQI